MDPVSTTLFSGINVAFRLAEYGLKVAEASEDKRLFCRLIERVRKDRSEAMRERREKAAQLKLLPAKKAWIDGAIADTDQALFEIGRLVEPGRHEVDACRGLTLKQRFEWVLLKKDTLLTKQSLLAFCHQSLSTAIAFMHDLPTQDQQLQKQISQQQLGAQASGQLAYSMPSGPPPTYTAEPTALRSPWARRPMPKKSYTVSEFAVPYECDFAGSIAEDLDRIFSDSSSISSSQLQQPQWDELSVSGTLATAVETDAGFDDGLVPTTSAEYLDRKGGSSDRQGAVGTGNDRRRRHEARFRATA